METIKGFYENGVIKPLSKIDLRGKFEVLITFLSPSKRDLDRFYSSAGGWKDLDTEILKKNIYESRKILTRKKVNL